MTMKAIFGELPDGTKIDLYELRNSKGMVVQVSHTKESKLTWKYFLILAFTKDVLFLKIYN